MIDHQVKVEPEDVLDRLARLRALLPAMATDLALARRRAHALAAENEQLSRRVRELELRVGETKLARPQGSRRRRVVLERAAR